MTRTVVAIVAAAFAALAAWHFLAKPPAPAPTVMAAPAPVASAAGLYRVVAEPADGKPGVGPIHIWKLTITDAAGKPVERATIAVDGGMPGHGHGLPSAPQVTAETAPGVYTLDGVKFSMTGDWQFRFAISAPAGNDTATVSFRIE